MAPSVFQAFFEKAADAFVLLRRVSPSDGSLSGTPVEAVSLLRDDPHAQMPSTPSPEYVLESANAAYAAMVGVSEHHLNGRLFRDVFPATDNAGDMVQAARWFQTCEEVLQSGKPATLDIHWSARALWVRADLFPISQDTLGVMLQNVTREYLQDQEIEGFLRVNLDMLCVTDMQGLFIRVNHVFEQVLGYSADEIEGQYFSRFVHADDLEISTAQHQQLRTSRYVSGFVNRYRHKDGSWRYLEWRSQAGDRYVYSSARDITSYKEMETRLQQMAADMRHKIARLETVSVTDELTGLFNRHHFEASLDAESERSDRHGSPLSMALLDIDRFKRLNDTWGHPVGDDVLRLTARTLQDTVRKSDLVFRVGGEEFVVLMPETSALGAVAAADKLRTALEHNSHPIAGTFTASFGVALRERGESTRRWYKRVDAALYQAKESGRNRVVLAEESSRMPVASVVLEWRSDWETGNTEVDTQHRELLEVANGLINMSLASMEQDKVLMQLDLLLRHISQHFRYEERVLELSDYPERKHHAKLHTELASKAGSLRSAFEAGELKGTAFFSFIVDDIIVGHMKVADARFVPWLKGHPIG